MLLNGVCRTLKMNDENLGNSTVSMAIDFMPYRFLIAVLGMPQPNFPRWFIGRQTEAVRLLLDNLIAIARGDQGLQLVATGELTVTPKCRLPNGFPPAVRPGSEPVAARADD
mmetsp:Transcript_57938/g.125257  ORF Transcript_57938/g.125257 Transcript_57938/m.125257 type:complete len:112 (+) Transcript_57938:39-374(+)